MQNIKFNLINKNIIEINIELPLRIHSKEKKISYMETDVIQLVEEKYGEKVKEILKSNSTISNYMGQENSKGVFVFKLDIPDEVVKVEEPIASEYLIPIKKGKKQKKEETNG